MTTDHPNRSFSAGRFSYTAFDEAAMLDRIGSDLRNLYGNVEDAALPDNLTRLASLIDEKRQVRGNQVRGKRTNRTSGAA